MTLGFAIRTQTPFSLSVGVECDSIGSCASLETRTIGAGDWREERIALSCLASPEADFRQIRTSLMFAADAGADFDIADVRLVRASGQVPACNPQAQ
jgi:hypothetical protein